MLQDVIPPLLPAQAVGESQTMDRPSARTRTVRRTTTNPVRSCAGKLRGLPNAAGGRDLPRDTQTGVCPPDGDARRSIQYRLEIRDSLMGQDLDVFVTSGFFENAVFAAASDDQWRQTRLEADPPPRRPKL